MNKLFHSLLIALVATTSITSAHAETVTELKERIIDIQNEGELGYHNFVLCSKIIGFGQYVPLAKDQVKVGSELLAYYEPKNLYTNRVKGTYQMWFTQDMILLDSEGEMLYEGLELLNFNYQTRSPVMDVYATNSLNLGDLPPGKYVFKIVMHDQLKDQNATLTHEFEIVE